MERLRVRIGDRRLLALVKAFLKAGILNEFGQQEQTLTGTPQGGILSPLLANVALSALDDYFQATWDEAMSTRMRRTTRRRKGLGTWRLVRYADDFVVMVSGTRANAEALREEVAEVLSPMGLRLSSEKTRVVHLDEGFDFLGFHIRKRRRRGTNKRYVYTYPSKEAVQSVKDKVRGLTRRSSIPTPPWVLLRSINAVVMGWARYFQHGVSKATFEYLYMFAWRRVTRWLRKRHPRMPWRVLFRRYMVCWRIVSEGVELSHPGSIGVTRYRYRGTRIATPWSTDAAA